MHRPADLGSTLDGTVLIVLRCYSFYSRGSSRVRLGVSLETRPRSVGWLRLAPRASGNRRSKPPVYRDLRTRKITSAGELALGGKLRAYCRVWDRSSHRPSPRARLQTKSLRSCISVLRLMDASKESSSAGENHCRQSCPEARRRWNRVLGRTRRWRGGNRRVASRALWWRSERCWSKRRPKRWSKR
jgi:hypothetical protein